MDTIIVRNPSKIQNDTKMNSVIRRSFVSANRESPDPTADVQAQAITQIIIFFFFQVHNVAFAFELMQDAGLPKPKSRAEGE